MIAPTAAPQPAALGRAMLIKKVTMTVPGIKMTRKRPKIPANRWTRCESHLVSFMTNAKPITVQMTVTKPGLTIALLKESTAAAGFPASAAMITPDRNSANLVSIFLTIATKVNNTIIPPTQIKEIPPHKIVKLLFSFLIQFSCVKREKKRRKIPSCIQNAYKTRRAPK